MSFGKEYTDEVIKKYAVMDESGNPKLDPKNPRDFVIKEGYTPKEVQEAFKKFTEKTMFIDRPRVKLDSFDGCGLSIEDYEVLEPIFVAEPLELKS